LVRHPHPCLNCSGLWRSAHPLSENSPTNVACLRRRLLCVHAQSSSAQLPFSHLFFCCCEHLYRWKSIPFCFLPPRTWFSVIVIKNWRFPEELLRDFSLPVFFPLVGPPLCSCPQAPSRRPIARRPTITSSTTRRARCFSLRRPFRFLFRPSLTLFSWDDVLQFTSGASDPLTSR